VTCTITLMDIAYKAAEMFRAIGQDYSAAYAQSLADDLRAAVRRAALDESTMTLENNGSQTPQAMGLYYGVFEAEEQEAAFARLLEMIHAKGDNFDCGLLGMHCLFHVLTAHGESELAYHLITKKDFPSYAHWIETGETSLVEMFMEKFEDRSSHNHHMYGDIARWFTTTLAGLRPVNDKKVLITPTPVGSLTWAQAHCDLPAGRVSVRWERDSADAKTIRLTYTVPEGVSATVQLPEGFEVG
jgi:alpha-L-rhamnosidase